MKKRKSNVRHITQSSEQPWLAHRFRKDRLNKPFSLKNYLNKDLGLNELSMGMSADYIPAINNNATFIRVGSKIFGERKKKILINEK